MQVWLVGLAKKLRPQKGWTSFLLMISLQLTLSASLRQTEWVDFKASHLPLEIGPLAVTIWLWLLLRPGQRSGGLGSRMRPILTVAGAVLLGAGLWLQQVTNLVGRWILWRPGEYRGLQQIAQEFWNYIAAEGISTVSSFSTRLSFWVEGVRGTGAQQDDLILIGIGGVILFLLAVQSTYMFLQGKSVFLSLLPSLAVIAYVLYFSQGSRLHLLGYLALLFSLFAWNQQQKLVETWQHTKVDYPDGIEFDKAIGVGGALLIMGLTAGAIPSIDIAKLTEWAQDALQPMDEATSDFGERMFPDLQSQVGGQDRSSSGGLPNSFLLGNSPELSNRIALKVKANYPFAEERGFYMRGTIYEKYDGKGWTNEGLAFSESIDANTALDPPPYPYRREIWQAVEFAADSHLAYAIAEPIKFSVKVRPETNILGVPLFFRNLDRRSYSVLSAMPLLNEDVLRDVPWETYKEVPPEILEIYLDLPDTVTDRTLSLARNLGQGAETPYDLGLAVESYLRELPYDLQVSLPGAGVTDVADYFLFELERGFCDYYTTAFVVLMRSRGIPVRFAAGYAPGNFTEFTEEWIFTDAQAHSWPEVWFPGLGWVPFEPTAGRQELDRTHLPSAEGSAHDSLATVTDPMLVDLASGSKFPWKAILGWSAFILALFTFLFLVPRWRSIQGDPWVSMLAWGRRMGQAKRAWETESEYSVRFANALVARPNVKEHEARAMIGQIGHIMQATVGAKYGPKTGPILTWNSTDRQWLHLRNRLRRIYFLRF